MCTTSRSIWTIRSSGKNKKLRQALSCHDQLGRSGFGFWNGRVIRAKAPIPPGVAGYEDKATPFPFDLDKAKALIAEAGYPNGIDRPPAENLQLTIELGSTDPQTREAVELAANFMRKIGVILNPSFNNWPTLPEQTGTPAVPDASGWSTWVARLYPDAQNFLSSSMV